MATTSQLVRSTGLYEVEQRFSIKEVDLEGLRGRLSSTKTDTGNGNVDGTGH